WSAGGRKLGEAAAHLLRDRLVDRAGEAKNQPVLGEEPGPLLLDVVDRDGGQSLLCTQLGGRVGVAAVEEGVEPELAECLVVLVANTGAQVAERIGAQALELGGVEAGGEEHLGKYLEVSVQLFMVHAPADDADLFVGGGGDLGGHG